MKLESARRRDLEDAGAIIRSERFEEVLDTAKTLEDLGFQIDFSVLMEAFELAYDIEWLTEYLEEHIEEVKKSILMNEIATLENYFRLD